MFQSRWQRHYASRNSICSPTSLRGREGAVTSKSNMPATLTKFAQRSVGMFMAIGVCMLGSPCFSAAEEIDAELRETGRLLAILLDSGRVAIGRNQSLLNDPSKGDKGFTPEVFASQAMAVFKERTGHDLADLAHANVPRCGQTIARATIGRKQKNRRQLSVRPQHAGTYIQRIYPGYVRHGDRHTISKVVRHILEANGTRTFAP